MRRVAAIVPIVLTLATDSATACHRFHYWAYHRPQSCRVTALAPRSAVRLPNARIDIALPAPRHIAPPAQEFSLPDLTDIEWGSPPDDELRGRLLLRVILQGKESK